MDDSNKTRIFEFVTRPRVVVMTEEDQLRENYILAVLEEKMALDRYNQTGKKSDRWIVERLQDQLHMRELAILNHLARLELEG